MVTHVHMPWCSTYSIPNNIFANLCTTQLLHVRTDKSSWRGTIFLKEAIQFLIGEGLSTVDYAVLTLQVRKQIVVVNQQTF